MPGPFLLTAGKTSILGDALMPQLSSGSDEIEWRENAGSVETMRIWGENRGIAG